MLPLWFRANSGLFRPLLGGPLRLLTATARAVGRGLGFDAPAVVSREFRCVLMLPLWFRVNSVAFRCSCCGFARIPASRGIFANSGLLLPKQCLHNGVLTFRVKELVADRNGARGGGTGPWFRRSRCGFARIPLRFDAAAVVWPVLGGPFRLPTATARAVGRGLGFDAPAVVSREFRCVSMLPLWFRANSVAFRCSRCGFARIPLHFVASSPTNFCDFCPRECRCSAGLLWPFLALLTVWGLRRHNIGDCRNWVSFWGYKECIPYFI